MNAKQIGLLIFVGVCTVLVAATVLAGIEENRQAIGAGTEERYSYSIGATPTPVPTVDYSELPEMPSVPAQYDGGMDPPTQTPDQGEDTIDT